MQARFILGPAGSGKTFRCLEEIRAALAEERAPDSEPLEPLVLLAPKQATFQLERQLLSTGELAGFTRLQVLSFERLAEFALERLDVHPPPLLSAEGQVMVLRALLRRHGDGLKLLRDTARRPGFAQELAAQLAELQQQRMGPPRLRALARQEGLRPELRDKLEDLAALAEFYAGWLKDHKLQDSNFLLEFATGQLRSVPSPAQSPFRLAHLWLDGFAEMTPQEHALLAAITPFCGGATLAFCLETEPTPPGSWLSIWSAIGKTYQRCREQLAALPGCEVVVEELERVPGKNRFPGNSAVGVLEAGWALPVTGGWDVPNLESQITVAECGTPEVEAVLAARRILNFVREGGNRFRDCAVLVRNLETYWQPIARTFRRYEIPFFLDRRENVTHHPLAELTRSSLRTVAGDWQHDDLFAALKAGFAPVPEAELDVLENCALASGWRGKKWREPLPDEFCERLRRRILPPFEKLQRDLQRSDHAPNGIQLAEALREFWRALHVEDTLEKWSATETGSPPAGPLHGLLHQTVFDQMNAWLENVALAFPREPMPLRDWLPVLDAGLAGLTVGVIPPALDEVLVGAIDRARNPDLKLTLLPGMNESVFPAPPPTPAILTNADRDELELQNASVGPNLLDQISRERYLGYIACTRSGETLALSFARQDLNGRALSPSPFIAHLKKIFSVLEIEKFNGALISDPSVWGDVEHISELIPLLVKSRQPHSVTLPAFDLPAVHAMAARLGRLREPDRAENLSPALAAKIYGPVLESSVSRLEEFAQCPFRFFVHSGLRAGERKRFELDARERGSFQHEVLKEFHQELTLEKKRWGDLFGREARERVGRIAARLAPTYREGLLGVDHQSRFAARALTASLQDFVETMVAWMREQYAFAPAKAETGFGLKDDELPAWEMELDGGNRLALRGRVDRIDLCEDGDRSLAVVTDYKSSTKKLEGVLIANGLQLQLLAYLAAVRRWPASFFGAREIVPAGVFYVNLRGQFEGGESRTEVLSEAAAARRRAYRHNGRFDAACLKLLDRRGARDQFNYQLKQDGGLHASSAEALSCKEFTVLLDQVEAQLRSLGERIFSGAAAVDPYRRGSESACDYCQYHPVCRVDPWTQEFRELRPARERSDAALSAT